MSFDPIGAMNNHTAGVVTDSSQWPGAYKDAYIERFHDKTMLDLVLPDDSLVVIGPSRLADFKSSSSSGEGFYPIGFVSSISYGETRTVQPIKALGSRRHIFAATNAPVSISLGRLLISGRNLYSALYAFSKNYVDGNPGEGTSVTDNAKQRYTTGTGWFVNAEEDLYRIPFGMGIIYKSPDQLRLKSTASKVSGAEYFECCVIQSRSVGLQSGQAMIMEQVQMVADRIIPFDGYTGTESVVS